MNADLVAAIVAILTGRGNALPVEEATRRATRALAACEAYAHRIDPSICIAVGLMESRLDDDPCDPVRDSTGRLTCDRRHENDTPRAVGPWQIQRWLVHRHQAECVGLDPATVEGGACYATASLARWMRETGDPAAAISSYAVQRRMRAGPKGRYRARLARRLAGGR